MAFIDALDILSDKQTIDGTVYSTKMKQISQAPCDWGHGGIPRWIAIVSHGNYTLGDTLEIQLQGCTKEDLSDAIVINTTGAIKAADIVEGWNTYLDVPAIGKKYQYIFLKYISSAGNDSNVTHDPTTCPTDPVLGEIDAIDDTFTAFVTLSISSHLTYPYANMEKTTG